MRKYDVLLSDADGTLFDFHAGEKAALWEVLKGYGLPSGDEVIAQYSAINDSHWKKLERGETTQARLRVERFADFLEAIGGEENPEEMCNLYVEKLGQQRVLLPGAEEFCRRISRHMPIFLVTNGLSKVQRSRFEGCAIAPYLKGFVISEEIGHQKPEPHMLEEALRQLGVSDCRRAVVLGDSITADIGAAKNAGMDSVLFTNGKAAPQGHGADYVAQTYGDAEKWILQEG